MWTDYQESFAHAEHRLLGRRLGPYCSYYHLWLRLCNSPLIFGGQVTHADLLIASRICSSRYGMAPLAIEPHRFDKLRHYWLALRCNVERETQAFLSYMRDYNSPPERNKTQSNTSKSEPIPQELWVVTGLMTNFGMSREEAWMCPIGEADWYLEISNFHLQRESNIVNGLDREFMEGMRRMRAAKQQTATTNG